MLVRLVGGVAATRRAAATRRSDASCRASLTPQTHVSKSRSDKPRLLRILYFFDSSTCRSDSSDSAAPTSLAKNRGRDVRLLRQRARYRRVVMLWSASDGRAHEVERRYLRGAGAYAPRSASRRVWTRLELAHVMSLKGGIASGRQVRSSKLMTAYSIDTYMYTCHMHHTYYMTNHLAGGPPAKLSWG